MSVKIKKIHAREILDSRGDPTVEVKVELIGGAIGAANVPSGASTGIHEALELRDNDKSRYGGKGVLQACMNVNNAINAALKGKNVTKQQDIDRIMIELDGTPNKSRLGANAILGVSLACACAASKEKKNPLYEYIAKIYGYPMLESGFSNYKLPIPMFNVFNGGKHADTNLDFQELMIMPVKSAISFCERVRIGAEIFHALGDVLKSKNLDTDVGNEGGYSPDISSPNQAAELIAEAIAKAGYELGPDVGMAMDVGSSTLFDAKENLYVLKGAGVALTPERLLSLYIEWINKYNFISVEDGLHEDDWEGWKNMKTKFLEVNKDLMIVGDDLTVTNENRIEMAIKENCANAIIIKLNQIGTLSETVQVVKTAQRAGWKIIVSHRSGETCDSFIADLAIAVGADYVKAGSLSRGERLAKYNRLMEIEEEIKR